MKIAAYVRFKPQALRARILTKIWRQSHYLLFSTMADDLARGLSAAASRAISEALNGDLKQVLTVLYGFSTLTNWSLLSL